MDYLATDDEDIRQFIKDSCQPGVWDAVEAFLVLWTSTLTAETIITTSDPEPLWPTTTPAAETKTASNPAVVPSEGRQT